MRADTERTPCCGARPIATVVQESGAASAVLARRARGVVAARSGAKESRVMVSGGGGESVDI